MLFCLMLRGQWVVQLVMSVAVRLPIFRNLSLYFFSFSVLSGWSHVAGLAEKLDQQWRPQSANMYISQSGPGLCVHVCSILETVIATLDHNGKKERERVRERERELVL